MFDVDHCHAARKPNDRYAKTKFETTTKLPTTEPAKQANKRRQHVDSTVQRLVVVLLDQVV